MCKCDMSNIIFMYVYINRKPGLRRIDQNMIAEWKTTCRASDDAVDQIAVVGFHSVVMFVGAIPTISLKSRITMLSESCLLTCYLIATGTQLLSTELLCQSLI